MTTKIKDKVKQSVENITKIATENAQSAGNAAKDILNKTADQVRKIADDIILLIPEGYKGQGNSINDLVKAADKLGIKVHQVGGNSLETANQIFATTEKVFGLTERGVAIFAPQLDQLMQRYQKLGNTLGGNAQNLGKGLGNVGSVLSTIQSFIGSAIVSMKLDDLIKKKNEGIDISKNDLAKASIDLINQLIKNVASVNNNIDSFSSQLSKMGALLSNTKSFSSIGNGLSKLPDVGKIGNGLDTVSGILSAVSAAFILGDKNIDEGTKAAAGIELTTKVLGNIGKAVSQYIVAQRIAQGLSTTAAGSGLIASAVALAISPLSFLGVADKFKRANLLEEYSKRFKNFGYEGDSLLASFHKETGAIDASLTTINTVLNSVSAGVGAAATASLVAAPVGILVSAVTGIITGILEASKQAMFEHVADKFAKKISDWENKYGKNYFENGYDARHSAFLEDSFELLSQFNKEYAVERAIIITQQHWDGNIGELAGVTKNGHRVQSGKAYVDLYEEGKRLQSSEDRFSKKIFDPTKGEINIPNDEKSNLLTFVTPTLTPGEEIRERKQTGKYEYMTSLIVNRKDVWTVNGNQDKGSVYDYSNLIQFANKGDTLYRAKIISQLGHGDDKIFSGAGDSEVYAGDGHDVMYYNKINTGLLTIDATNESKKGEYTVHRGISGDVNLLQEVVKEQDVSVGKRTEKIQYRHYELKPHHNPGNVIDKLHSVEEIIAGSYNDTFKGSKFTDIFHGAGGDDYIDGNDGNDRLYGDDGNDTITGGNGNDWLYGGNGNDSLKGGAGNNYLNGGDGNDEIQANGVDKNILIGGKGNDKLYGGGGIDLLDAGEGNDYLLGGDGNDIYQYRSNYGHHIIEDDGGYDKLSLADISFKDVAFKRINDDLIMNKSENGILSFNEKNDVNGITFKNWFKKTQSKSVNYKIEQLIDKDGRIIDSDGLERMFDEKNKQNKSSYILGNDVGSQADKNNLITLANDINGIISAVSSFDTESNQGSVVSLS
ncbi:MAG: RTX family hemolysin, partial [Microcoleaceae cyanobacterium]